MATTKKKPAPEPRKAPAPAAEEAKAAPPKEAAPQMKPKAQGSALKTAAVVILLVVALALAYYFMNQSSAAFVPGASVDADTFKSAFAGAKNIFIVMDIRGVNDQIVSNNIIQCGVDFAQSSGMGNKTQTPISFGKDGCWTPEGQRDPQECFSLLKNGLTIYVKQGQGGVAYYSNGMVVTVGSNYTLGGCSISRT